MKTIGLIGGMSWESTVTYYQLINQFVAKKLGGLHSAQILLYSVDFEEIERCQSEGNWEKSGEILANIAQKLETAGADFIVICTNTMHKVAPQIAKVISISIIHIAETTAEVLQQSGIQTVGLLGTKYTMQQDFYKAKLIDKGLKVIIPDEQDMEIINRIIFEELCLGKINPDSRQFFQSVIDKLKKHGAEGVILGCTEIGLLIKPENSNLPVFDTTLIHAQKAAECALA